MLILRPLRRTHHRRKDSICPKWSDTVIMERQTEGSKENEGNEDTEERRLCSFWRLAVVKKEAGGYITIRSEIKRP